MVCQTTRCGTVHAPTTSHKEGKQGKPADDNDFPKVWQRKACNMLKYTGQRMNQHIHGCWGAASGYLEAVLCLQQPWHNMCSLFAPQCRHLHDTIATQTATSVTEHASLHIPYRITSTEATTPKPRILCPCHTSLFQRLQGTLATKILPISAW